MGTLTFKASKFDRFAWMMQRVKNVILFMKENAGFCVQIEQKMKIERERNLLVNQTSEIIEEDVSMRTLTVRMCDVKYWSLAIKVEKGFRTH